MVAIPVAFLSNLIIVGLATGNCEPSLAVREGDRPEIVFGTPKKIKRMTRRRTVRLRKDALLAEERYLVPVIRYVSSAPILARDGQMAPGGRMFVKYRWRGFDWACLARRYKSELESVSKGPGFCIRDTNGDHLADTAAVGDENIGIQPVEMVPLGREFMEPRVSTLIKISLRVTDVRRTTFVVEGTSDTTVGGFPYWSYSFGKQYRSRSWPRKLRLSNLKTYNLVGVRVRTFRRGKTWKARVTGAFRSPLKVCNDGTALWVAGATLTKT